MSVVEFGHFVLTIAILLGAVHGLGYLAERLKQPRICGRSPGRHSARAICTEALSTLGIRQAVFFFAQCRYGHGRFFIGLA
jgi:hypothetical protein